MNCYFCGEKVVYGEFLYMMRSRVVHITCYRKHEGIEVVEIERPRVSAN